MRGGSGMIVIGGFLLGAALGALVAQKQERKGADIALFAAGYGIAFAALGLFVRLGLSQGL